MMRRSTIALLGVLALTGCKNMGLDYAGPADEAAVDSPSDLVAAVHERGAEHTSQGLIVDGRKWVSAGVPGPLPLGEEELRPVGSAAGSTVYARHWDRAPYDMLFTRVAESDAWQGHVSVTGGGGMGGRAAGGSAPGH